MECGCARVEITPPSEACLFGYPDGERRYKPHLDKVLDPLHARAVYLHSGSSPGILLITLDLCLLFTEDAIAFRTELSGKLRLPVENILLCCTHTHSAPLARMSLNGNSSSPGKAFHRYPHSPQGEVDYGRWILARLERIAALAISRRAPVTGFFRQSFSGHGYNRRCRTPDGVRNCWNIESFRERVPKVMRDLPHSVLKLAYQGREGGVVLDNLGIHPVVMGKESTGLSADWPSYARRYTEKRLKNYQAVFTQGAGAQVQPWISTQEDPRALHVVGEAIGAETVLLSWTADPVYLPDNSLRINEHTLPSRQVRISTLELGSILLVGLPFELSATMASRLRRLLRRPVLFFCLCNGWDGYWMAPEEFAEGGYETEIAHRRGVGPENSLSLLELLKPFQMERSLSPL